MRRIRAWWRSSQRSAARRYESGKTENTGAKRMPWSICAIGSPTTECDARSSAGSGIASTCTQSVTSRAFSKSSARHQIEKRAVGRKDSITKNTKIRGPKAQYGSRSPQIKFQLRLKLEDKLEHQLNASCIVCLVPGGDLPEIIRGRIHLNRAAAKEPGMIESIQEINPYLNLCAFCDRRVLEERQVNVVHVFRTHVREPERERTNVPRSRLNRRCAIESRDVEPFVERPLIFRQRDLAAEVNRVGCEVKRWPNLPGVNSRNLPTAEHPGSHAIAGVAERFAFSKRQFVNPAQRDAVWRVKRRDHLRRFRIAQVQ